MSKFLTTLKVEQVEDNSEDGRGSWKLLAPLAYKSDVAQTIFVAPMGFVTDFASVPRLPIAYMLTGGYAQAAAVIHDLLYSTHEVSRSMADSVFHEAILSAGGSKWRAALMYAGVRVGGWTAWDQPGQNPGMEA